MGKEELADFLQNIIVEIRNACYEHKGDVVQLSKLIKIGDLADIIHNIPHIIVGACELDEVTMSHIEKLKAKMY